MNVVIITAGFPYGKGEGYIKNELDIALQYGNISILPMRSVSDSEAKVELNSNVQLLKLSTKKAQNSFVKCLKVLFSKDFYAEVFRAISARKFSIALCKEIFLYIAAGQQQSRMILDTLQQQKMVRSETILYSYWMSSSAYAISLLKKKVAAVVCRAHGFDVYSHRSRYGYQIMQKHILKQLDGIYPVSMSGVEYLRKVTPTAKINLARLGVPEYEGSIEIKHKADVPLIVTCAYLVKLKRVDLLIQALSVLDMPFQWVHFGGGAEWDRINQLACELLPSNSYCINGDTSNAEIEEFYKNNNVSLFVNVSESEGLPVSIMEAMKYGIPVLATSVGGTPEIVNDGKTGFLIDKDQTPSSLAQEIKRVLSLSDTDSTILKQSARDAFMQDYNAVTNYQLFYSNLKGLVENKKKSV